MKKIFIVLSIILVLIVLSPTVLADKGKIEIIPFDKQVKEDIVKEHLISNGMNPSEVILIEDYSAEHPNTRIYTNIKTGDIIELFDTLPHVNKQGQYIHTAWIHYYYGDAYWVSGTNTFVAKVNNTEVKVEKDGERLWWNPELYVGGNRIYPINNQGTLLRDDPYNSNYHDNVLEWDYGVCLRHVRIIEGFIAERWVFDSNPKGEVVVKHRQGGHLKLGIGILSDAKEFILPVEVQQGDWEIIRESTLQDANYPIILGASMTLYPGVDGLVGSERSLGSTWADIRTGLYYNAYQSYTASQFVSWTVWGVNLFTHLYRSDFIFNTSSLPDTTTVTAGTFSLFGSGKASPLGDNPNINIYSTATAYNDYLIGADWHTFGSTAYCATPITYANWNIAGYNDFTLNAAGLAAINLTGYTKIAARNQNYDVANVAPSQATITRSDTWLGGYWAEKGSGYQPKLVLTYTATMPNIIVNWASNVAATSARLNALVVTDGGEACTVRFGYGTSSQIAANFLLYDTVTSYVGGYTTGMQPYYDATGLLINTNYYYRVQITNSGGTYTSTSEMTFKTEDGIVPPGNMTGIPTATTVALHWEPGQGASTTYIRASYNTYPGNTSLGLFVCDTPGASFTHEDLDSGKTIFYSAWGKGEGAGNLSATYTTLVVTTRMSTDVAIDVETPELPFGFSQNPDYTAFSKMPGYLSINELADNFNIPRASFWFTLQILIMAAVTISVSLVGGATLGVISGAGVGAGFVIMGGMPSGYIAMVALFALGYGILRWRAAG